jgi:DNA-directed RNA polymerase subunit M/transcription elongation factor TFIIS
MPPFQPDPSLPAPIWICPICQKLMRTRTIEVADGEEQTKLACATCGNPSNAKQDAIRLTNRDRLENLSRQA